MAKAKVVVSTTEPTPVKRGRGRPRKVNKIEEQPQEPTTRNLAFGQPFIRLENPEQEEARQLLSEITPKNASIDDNWLESDFVDDGFDLNMADVDGFNSWADGVLGSRIF